MSANKMLKVCFVILCIIVYAKTDTNSNYTACDSGKRLCVPYYLCNRNLESSSDLDDQSSESDCEDYFEICCELGKILVIDLLSLIYLVVLELCLEYY